jgi:hypothetical protein
MEALAKRAKEADVEARIIIPLLTAPEFLGIPHSNVRNKAYLYPKRIDKAAGKTSGYYPDFSVWDESLPLVVVEAKAPAVEAEVGYREACQYALHLNQQYRANLDPCSYVVSTNGQKIIAGFWNAPPEIDAPVGDLTPGTATFELLRSRIGHDILRQAARELREKIDRDQVYGAARGALGESLTHSKVPPNQFASALIPTLERYFASQTEDDDPAIYDKGYVPTTEQLSYDTILEGLLREKAHLHNNPFSKDIKTNRTSTKDFSEQISQYSQSGRNAAQLLLVIGHVGAGKSLFIRRYRELLVPGNLAPALLWSFINFNNFSEAKESPARWLSEQYIGSFAEEQPEIDIYSGDLVDHIFATELNRQRSVYERIAKVDVVAAEKEKAADIKSWLADPQKLAMGLTRHFAGEQGKVCVAVFDNVDKLDKDEQLAVFQLALGFTAEHRTLSILQLRDETFERYKDSKPLDTFKTGVSFHITPPRFANVVRRRLELAIDDLRQNAPTQWEYDLSNGARVRIGRDQALNFLYTVFDYVFGRDVNASRVLQGLAGRNVRRALDIFFKVLISGHLTNERITSVGAGGGSFPIDDNLMLRTLMREDYRFFHNGSGYIRNIFFFDSEWTGADNLLIPELLYFLASHLKTKGNIGLEGFFTSEAIFDSLQMMGYVRETMLSALQWLLKQGLVEADNMSTTELRKGTALRITSAGFIHIRVLSERLEYVSGCLYEATYLSADIAGHVRQMLEDSIQGGGLSMTRKAQGVQEFRKYVRQLKTRREQVAPNLIGQATAADYVLNHVEVAIAESIRPQKPLPATPDPLDL